MIFFVRSSSQPLPLGSNFGWQVRFYHDKINCNHRSLQVIPFPQLFSKNIIPTYQSG